MSTVPYAVRLPKKLAAILETFAKKTGMSPPDAVRAAIEQSLSSEYRMLMVDSLTDKAATLARVSDYLDPPARSSRKELAPQDYSAMMCFWHFAYMHSGMEGYANPIYIDALLDITSELITEAQTRGLPVDDHYIRSKLDLETEESYQNGIARIKKKFRENPSVGYAEWLTRPLEGMSDELHLYDRASLPRIFGSAMKIAYPVAVTGANIVASENIITRDLEPLLPAAETYQVGELKFTVYSNSLSLVVSGKNHIYAFCPESVLSLATAIENSALPLSFKNNETHTSFNRKSINILQFDNEVTIHERGGYRLTIRIEDFNQLISSLNLIFKKLNWAWLINRHRSLKGDI